MQKQVNECDEKSKIIYLLQHLKTGWPAMHLKREPSSTLSVVVRMNWDEKKVQPGYTTSHTNRF